MVLDNPILTRPNDYGHGFGGELLIDLKVHRFINAKERKAV
jgi:hypothetical protein